MPRLLSFQPRRPSFSFPPTTLFQALPYLQTMVRTQLETAAACVCTELTAVAALLLPLRSLSSRPLAPPLPGLTRPVLLERPLSFPSSQTARFLLPTPTTCSSLRSLRTMRSSCRPHLEPIRRTSIGISPAPISSTTAPPCSRRSSARTPVVALVEDVYRSSDRGSRARSTQSGKSTCVSALLYSFPPPPPFRPRHPCSLASMTSSYGWVCSLD